jgi:hypothetical protein
MNTLIGPEGTACGEILRAMQGASHWWHEENAQDRKEKGVGDHQLQKAEHGPTPKFLDKFYNKRDIPWVKLVWNTYYGNGKIPHASRDRGSFWWRNILKLLMNIEQ